MLDIKIQYMIVCCSKLCIDIVTLYTGRGIPPLLHMVFLPFLPVKGLKWNSRQKATEALFAIEYESNLHIKA